MKFKLRGMLLIFLFLDFEIIQYQHVFISTSLCPACCRYQRRVAFRQVPTPVSLCKKLPSINLRIFVHFSRAKDLKLNFVLRCCLWNLSMLGGEIQLLMQFTSSIKLPIPWQSYIPTRIPRNAMGQLLHEQWKKPWLVGLYRWLY